MPEGGWILREFIHCRLSLDQSEWVTDRFHRGNMAEMKWFDKIRIFTFSIKERAPFGQLHKVRTSNPSCQYREHTIFFCFTDPQGGTF